MKKLLLLLSVAAYLCVSCNKDNTIEDKGNCTLKIVYTKKTAHAFSSKLYNTSSDNVDFDNSIKSLLRRGTITLKDGSYAQAIDSNYVWANGYINSWEGASFLPPEKTMTTHNLPYGSYIVIMWDESGFGTETGRPYTKFMYRNFMFNKSHTSDSVNFNVSDIQMSIPYRKFTEI